MQRIVKIESAAAEGSGEEDNVQFIEDEEEKEADKSDDSDKEHLDKKSELDKL